MIATAPGYLKKGPLLDELTILINNIEIRRLKHVLQLVAYLKVTHFVHGIIGRLKYVRENGVNFY